MLGGSNIVHLSTSLTAEPGFGFEPGACAPCSQASVPGVGQNLRPTPKVDPYHRSQSPSYRSP